MQNTNKTQLKESLHNLEEQKSLVLRKLNSATQDSLRNSDLSRRVTFSKKKLDRQTKVLRRLRVANDRVLECQLLIEDIDNKILTARQELNS